IKGVVRFGKRRKLNPIYIGPFEILDRVNNVSYRLALPLILSYVHPIFHISMLCKYILDPSYVLQPQEVEIDKHLSYEETFLAIVDRRVKKLKNKELPMVKVQWHNHKLKKVRGKLRNPSRTNINNYLLFEVISKI